MRFNVRLREPRQCCMIVLALTSKFIVRSAVAPLPADIQGAVIGVSTLSIADQRYVHELDIHQSKLYVFCGKCDSSVPHLIFDCDHPKLIEARTSFSTDSDLASIEQHILDNSKVLPAALQQGITPPLALMPDTPCWTDTMPDNMASATSAAKTPSVKKISLSGIPFP